jgi:integrase
VLKKVLARTPDPDTYLFRHRRRNDRGPNRRRREGHGVYTAESLAGAVRRAAAAAGLPGWHLYRVRHAFRSRAVRAVGVEAARLLMGHASAETTALYGERDARAAADAARRIS